MRRASSQTPLVSQPQQPWRLTAPAPPSRGCHTQDVHICIPPASLLCQGVSSHKWLQIFRTGRNNKKSKRQTRCHTPFPACPNLLLALVCCIHTHPYWGPQAVTNATSFQCTWLLSAACTTHFKSCLSGFAQVNTNELCTCPEPAGAGVGFFNSLFIGQVLNHITSEAAEARAMVQSKHE